jgi:hypothetical protein
VTTLDDLPENEIAFDSISKMPAVELGSFLRILVIGLGGVGTALLSPLCRYLAYAGVGERIPLMLFDGDDFERKNRERQDFQGSGNKAQVKAREMRRLFPELSLRAVPEFITSANASFYIQPGDLVFLAVDNHASRKIVSHQCEEMDSIVLISGGNEWSDGNVQIHVKREGEDLTSPLTRFHPEIEAAADETTLFSCDDHARAGDPQLLFTNLMVASHMLNTFYALTKGELSYEELYFDIVLGKSVSIDRRS